MKLNRRDFIRAVLAGVALTALPCVEAGVDVDTIGVGDGTVSSMCHRTPAPMAMCWRITRTDGHEFLYTDHVEDVRHDGDVYRANVDDILEVDAVDGLFDDARIRGYLVDTTDQVAEGMMMCDGRVGEITVNLGGEEYYTVVEMSIQAPHITV